jgi:acetyl-CoA C-acetyltransferase
MSQENRRPVIVGIGQINDRPTDDAAGMDSFELMRAALERADADAGGGWLQALQSLAVVDQLSFPQLGDVSRPLAEALGATPAHCEKTRYPSGDSPILLLNQAARRIANGELEVAAVVGGEALRTAAKRAASAHGGDAVRDAASRGARPLRQSYGIVAPTDIYPLYENACRAAWGQTLAEGQNESVEIWSRFSEVAADSEGAWLKKRYTPMEIIAPTPDNRPIAFPYTKLMVANASVNQGAGFIVTSAAKARAMGVAEHKLIYVGAGAAAREPGDVLARDTFNHSASLEASIREAMQRNGLDVGDLDCVELYSCFPCIPKMARRVLGWPLDKPASVFGGLTFGGGPVGNYMSHAVAAMTARLRAGGLHGLLFANGGFATTNHSIVLSRDPAIAANAAQDFDVQAQADAARGPIPAFVQSYEGAATIETYTVFFDRAGAAKFGAIVARSPAGERLLARVDGGDASEIEFLTSGAHEPVGASGTVSRDADGLARWRSN